MAAPTTITIHRDSIVPREAASPPTLNAASKNSGSIVLASISVVKTSTAMPRIKNRHELAAHPTLANANVWREFHMKSGRSYRMVESWGLDNALRRAKRQGQMHPT
jgi:hypothetical protein